MSDESDRVQRIRQSIDNNSLKLFASYPVEYETSGIDVAIFADPELNLEEVFARLTGITTAFYKQAVLDTAIEIKNGINDDQQSST